jgi:MobC-like protein
MMKKKIASRTRNMNIALTEEEYDLLQKKFKETIFQTFSEYIRSVLFNKRIVTTCRNRSFDDFLSIAAPMKSQLDAAGRHFAQAVRHLRHLPPDHATTATLTTLLKSEFELRQHIDAIKALFLKIYDHVCYDQTLRRNG